jgi:transposase-like protein
VNHTEKEYARREKGVLISTNSVESYFAIVKRGHFGVYHHWSKKYLGQYLREFDWRYNVRLLPDMERTVVALKMAGGKTLMLKPPQN